MQTRTIYIFRHGQTDWNAEGRIQGHIDIPLNDLGRSQARRLIPALRKLGVQAFLSSDLSRASETAEIISIELGLPSVSLDPRLREIHLGKIQGLNRLEIEKLLGPEFSSRLRSAPLADTDVELLGSESGQEVNERALQALLQFARETSFERIGVATHGGVIRRLIQFAVQNQHYPAPIPNGIVYPLVLDLVSCKLHYEGLTRLSL
ncbi:MAG: histidine phosphatase family protein [Methylotenera sp.]|nr:histidine phosphatase family protein [Oligoflexia bacterium]